MTEEQKEIRRKRAIDWNRAHPERHLQNVKLWALRNAEMLKAKRRDYDTKNKEKNTARVYKFISATPWYWIWTSAKQRCTNPSNPRYNRYGGRGIRFELSKADMSFLWQRDNAQILARPSIDRIDNDGHYTLSNCHFIEKSDNSRKRGYDLWRKKLREEEATRPLTKRPSSESFNDQTVINDL